MILRLALVLGLLVEEVLAHNTLLVDDTSTTSQESPIHLTNATASISSAGLVPNSGRTFFTISEMSGLSLVSIRLVSDSHIPSIVVGNGQVLIDRVLVPSHTRLDTLYHSSGVDSTIALKSSEISDMVYSGLGGLLLIQ